MILPVLSFNNKLRSINVFPCYVYPCRITIIIYQHAFEPLKLTCFKAQIIFESHTNEKKFISKHKVYILLAWSEFSLDAVLRIEFQRLRGRDTSVGIATGCMLDGWVRSQAGVRFFFLFHSVYASFVVHPVSYPMGTGGSFHGGKAAGVWSWPFNSTYYRGEEWWGLYLHSPYCLHGIVLN
jgi:hypothetical protein